MYITNDAHAVGTSKKLGVPLYTYFFFFLARVIIKCGNDGGSPSPLNDFPRNRADFRV